MFLLEAPQVRPLETFTRLPDRFRRRGVASEWAQANRGGLETDSFLEGPVFDDAGHLFVTDIPFGRIFRIDAAGEWDLVAEYDGWPNGMKRLGTGALLVTDYKRGLVEVDIASGKARDFLGHRNSERFKGLMTSRSTREATSISRTRARPGCMIRRDGSIGSAWMGDWTCSCPTRPARMASSCRRTSASSSWP
jgi:sugar lactone lactonase YvrE